MIKVTNNAPGPRGIAAAGVIAMLQPGETADLDVGKADLAAARKTGWFIFEGAGDTDRPPAAPDADTLDKLSDDELRAKLKDKGVQADGRWGHDRLVEELKKAQG